MWVINMNVHMLNQLIEFVGIPVKLMFYVGDMVSVVQDKDIFIYYGTILEVFGSHVLKFDHIELDKGRLQVKYELLDLHQIYVYSICPLSDDFDAYVSIKCIHCGKGMSLVDLKAET